MKRYSILVFALLGGAFVCVIAAAMMLFVKDVVDPPVTSSAAESYSGGYLLTVYGGFVAVKQMGEPEPCRTFETPETMLSDYDKALLGDGIYCETLDEALRRAEDFIG